MLLHRAPNEATINLAELIDKWQRANTSLPEKLGAVQTRDGLSIDMLKVKIFESICAADSMSQLAQSLDFWKNPFQVRTGSAPIKVGALTLAPVVTLMQITHKSSLCGFKLGSFEVDGDAVDFLPCPQASLVLLMTKPWKILI